LKSLQLEPGSLIATVANAGMYATTAIIQAGLRPLYIDVDAASMTMDPASLRASLEAGPAAIIVTHLYGQMAPIIEISKIADAAGLPLIEDCAQAHGAEIEGRRAGAWGTLGCFSFYPTKNLGALGDGGAVVTNDSSLESAIRSLRQYGWTAKYRSDIPAGRNSRLDEIQAAMLRTKLPYLNAWNERRRQIAKQYSEAFADLPLISPPLPSKSYVAHLYVVRTDTRDDLRAALSQAGIATDVHYPTPDYQQRSIASRLSEPLHLPVTEECCNRVMTLPCFPEMDDAEVERVIESVYAANTVKATTQWAKT
jgi:dTDP-4-amino-4,6-dideoxygalactose transaminase